MPTTVEGGATMPNDKKVIGVYLSPKLFQRVEDAREKIGLGRSQFCVMAILNEVERRETNENHKSQR